MKQPTKFKLKSITPLIKSITLLLLSVLGFGIGILWFFQIIKMNESISATLASQLSLLIFAFALFELKTEHIVSELKRDIKLKTLLQTIIVTAIVLMFNAIIGLFISNKGLSNAPETTQSIVNSKSFILTFLLPVVVAPFVEELAFRAGLKRVLVDEGGWNPFLYIIISSLMFGMLHWQPGSAIAVAHVTLTTIMGVIYSIVYIKTNNIYIPIISHMLYNGLVVTIATLLL